MPCSVSAELAALQSRLSQAERLARLEVELAAREAEARIKVRARETLRFTKLLAPPMLK
jgi:hypothetical protein